MSQVVNFTDPAVIAQLQNEAGTNVSTIGSMPQYEAFLADNLICTTGLGTAANMTGAPISNTDRNGIANKAQIVVYGNAFSGQQGTYAIGTKNAAGDPADVDSLFNWGSNTKMLCYVSCAKMMEEGYFNLSENIGTYVPSFTGFGYAWSNASGTPLAADYINAPNFSSFTGTINRIDLGAITIAQAFAMQIHASYGSLSHVYPGNMQSSYLGSVTNSDWGSLYSTWQAQKACQLGLSLGATAACQLFAPGVGTNNATFVPGTGAISNFYLNATFGVTATMSGPWSDYLFSMINCIKAGVVPLAFIPGSNILSQQNIFGPKSAYSDLSMLLMNAVCAGALQKKQGTTGFPTAGTYPTLISYTRAKLLAPLGMNSTNSSFGGIEGVGSITVPICDTTWRRSYVNTTGWYAEVTNSDPTYAPVYNSLVWTSQFPNDGMSRSYNALKNTVSNDPIWLGASTFWTTPRLYANFLIMLINKGVFNGIKILNQSTVKWMLNAKVAVGIEAWETASGRGDFQGPAVSYVGCGMGKISSEFAHIYEVFSTNQVPSGLAESSTTSNMFVPFANSDSTIYWGGIYGSSVLADLSTGNYIVAVNLCLSVNAATKTMSAQQQARFLAKYN